MHFTFFVLFCSKLFLFSYKNTFAYSSESVFIILFLCIFLFSAELLIYRTLFSFLSNYCYFSLSPYSSKKVWLLPSAYDCFLSSSGFCAHFLHCLIFVFDSLSIISTHLPSLKFLLRIIFFQGSFTSRVWGIPPHGCSSKIIDYPKYHWDRIVNLLMLQMRKQIQTGSPELPKIMRSFRSRIGD